MPVVGESIGGYRVIEVLGGGMAEVFICERASAGDETQAKAPVLFALKTFRKNLFFDQPTRIAFIREATTWLRITGVPHILPLLRIDELDDRPFLVMPAVPFGADNARTVADLITLGPLEPEHALRIAFQVALGLDLAAAQMPGLVHGDIKPANVLLWYGDAFLGDFGLVSTRTLWRPDTTLESTWAYRAPELWRGSDEQITAASDVYAFGVLVYQMLEGRLPFLARDRSGWLAAHRDEQPECSPRFRAGGIAEGLMRLALECLQKQPSDRPREFAAVRARVESIYRAELLDAELLTVLWRSSQIKSFLDTFVPQLANDRIRGLLRMGEPAQALAEVERTNASQRSAEMWRLQASALSLLNRDAEALPCFEKALAGNLTEDERVSTCVEQALSLKRVGRLAEAEAVYEDLLLTVPDAHVTSVIVNLATVYLAQRRPADVRRLLAPFVQRVPGSGEAWGNLARAYELLSEHKAAADAYGRAIQLLPSSGSLRVMQAALYMDHLGRIEEAYRSLDLAFDSGYESRDWLVRILTCAVLLRRDKVIQSLAAALNANFDSKVRDAIFAESEEMTARLIRKYQGDEAREDKPATDAGPSREEIAPQAPPTDASEVAPLEPAGERSRASRHATLPFVNYRYYESLDFTLDFYEDPGHPNYFEMFKREWRRATRDPRLGSGGVALRGSPFYFARCPNCKVHILTNREPSYRITCRMCGETSTTARIDNDARLGDLGAQIEALTGVAGSNRGEMYDVLFAQPPPGISIETIRAVCGGAGMTELAPKQLLAVYLLREAVTHGARPELPWAAWSMKALGAGGWSQTATPHAIAAVVREVQRVAPGTRTMSMTVPAEQVRKMQVSIAQIAADMEDDARRAITEGRAGAEDYRQLAVALLNRGALEEAEQKARAALALDKDSSALWQTLGEVLIKREQFAAAAGAIEEASKLEPSSAFLLHLLAFCYERIGDGPRARELRTRAVGLAGPDIPLPK